MVHFDGSLISDLSSTGSPTPPRKDAAVFQHNGKIYLLGGEDSMGRPSKSMFSFDTNSQLVNCHTNAWKTVEQTGNIPAAPSRHPPSCQIWGEQLWLLSDDCGSTPGSKSPAERSGGIPDLHRFEFLAHSWSLVEQHGCLPDQRLATLSPFRVGFDRVVAYGPYLLAFGCEQGDENKPPPPQAPIGRAAAGAGAPQQQQLMLHAYDFCAGTWSCVPTSGAPCFTHCCALAVVGHRLVAVGHSPSPAAPKAKLNAPKATTTPPASGSATPPPPPPLPPSMRVSVLDMSGQGGGNGPLTWTEIQTYGQAPPVPETAVVAAAASGNSSFLGGGSCAFVVCENQLVMLIGGGASASAAGGGGAGGAGGGQAAGPAAAAAAVAAAAGDRLFALDLADWSWSSVAVPQPEQAGAVRPQQLLQGVAPDPGRPKGQRSLVYEPQGQALYIIGGGGYLTQVGLCQCVSGRGWWL